MKELSIFVDESGDFDVESKHSPYYVFSLVFHNQSKSIKNEIDILNSKIAYLGFENHAIHTEPLIRKESPYQNETWEKRRKIFYSLYLFAWKCPIKIHSFIYKKREYKNKNSLVSMMARDLSAFIRDNLEMFNSFDKVKVYYDNGQNEISNILNVSLNSFLQNVEIANVKPKNYKLFQVADFVCTIELLNIKNEAKTLSKSEKGFFATKDLKTYIKAIHNKRI